MRILDVLTNPNSLFGTKGGKQPVNPYVSLLGHVYLAVMDRIAF